MKKGFGGMGRFRASLPMGALVLAIALPPEPSRAHRTDPSELLCAAPVEVWEGGHRTGFLCPEEARARGLTIVDLSDDWVPRLFRNPPDASRNERQPYRSTLLRLEDTPSGLSMYGVLPSPSVAAAELSDSVRHYCHSTIDGGPLERGALPLSVGARGPAIAVVQDHLRCARLLPSGARTGVLDGPTARALQRWQEQNMLAGAGVLDGPTRTFLLLDDRERAFRALLRSLRERVVDALGLIEDGSASQKPEPVLGRWLEDSRLRAMSAYPPLPRAAPDLVARATTIAAWTLGWSDPDAARAFFAARPPGGVAALRVALRLPPPPPWHGPQMDLHAVIDRGDVWYDFPWDGHGDRLVHPVARRPSIVLYARSHGQDIALCRWRTTIGGWNLVQQDDGTIAMEYKSSPPGHGVWRDLVASPVWLPPDDTPDAKLMWRDDEGAWHVNRALMGPDYRAAFGLGMAVHLDRTSQGSFHDVGIRTHGTGDYPSVLLGHSHGCHRLFNHLAVRLLDFLLAHREHTRLGPLPTRYLRRIPWDGTTQVVAIHTRGYGFRLDPPVPVDVLPGRILGGRREPVAGTLPVPQPLRAELPTPGGSERF